MDLDGSETLTIEITDVPTGATLTNTAGDDFSGATSFELTADQLDGLNITPPANSDVDFTLIVKATAVEENGALLPSFQVASPYRSIRRLMRRRSISIVLLRTIRLLVLRQVMKIRRLTSMSHRYSPTQIARRACRLRYPVFRPVQR